MRGLASLALLALVAVVAAQRQKTQTCYVKDSDPYLFFGSKTAYEFVKENSRTNDVPYCEPQQLWMVARHGTRYPEGAEVKEMRNLHEMRNQILRNHEERRDGSLCAEDLQALKKWNLEPTVVHDRELTNQGRMDMEFIARRYKTRFPALLTRHFTSDNFVFRYTNTQRTRASADAFASGLFGGSESSVYLPQPHDNDTLLQPYKSCHTWRERVGDNPNTERERELFNNSTYMQGLVSRVSERLGFRYKIGMNKIDLMYDMCRYDKAWEINELSPWCSAFTRDELRLLEYREDLKSYYKSGYGNEINSKLGCPLVKDLMQRFSLLANKTYGQPVGVFYFTHSTAVLQVLSALGIAKDIPKLLHNNYELMQHRKWQSSQIGPFSSNVAAVFFKCSRGDPHRVMFFLEERVVPYDGCDVGLCSWEFVQQLFGRVASECNLDWCKEGYNAAGRLGAAMTVMVVTLMTTLMMV